jgi:NAD(P)-dependent dehydrogenase (short-subunit alcohol dehydrogenase family)
MQLKEKVVLVTGGARGIGEAVCVAAKERGDEGQRVEQRLNGE